VLDLCIGNFIVADPKGRGPYYGVAGYWCWITPAYSLERYMTEYLFMFTAAGFSFILYSLVFFRLRGNITVSDGYRIYFHQRPRLRVGRTNSGTLIVTDDRSVESPATTVAKQMLWYPIAYTVIVLPVATARFSTFRGASVPFGVTIFTGAVFMLSGFVNSLLFGMTRTILPGSWRRKLCIGNRLETGQDAVSQPSHTGAMSQFTLGPSTSIGTVGAGTAPVTLGVGMEKNIEIKYDEAEPDSSFPKFGPPSDIEASARIRPASEGVEYEVLQHPGHTYGGHGSSTYEPAQAPAFVHPFVTAVPIKTDTQSLYERKV
jgi:hypothetical protein